MNKEKTFEQFCEEAWEDEEIRRLAKALFLLEIKDLLRQEEQKSADIPV